MFPLAGRGSDRGVSMIIRMKPTASSTDVDHIVRRVRGWGLDVYETYDGDSVVLSGIGETRAIPPDSLSGLRGIDTIHSTHDSCRSLPR